MRRLGQQIKWPIYHVWQPDEGTERQDATAVEAMDEEDAARIFAQRQCDENAESYSAYEDGDGVEIMVESPSGERCTMTVGVEFKPSFRVIETEYHEPEAQVEETEES